MVGANKIDSFAKNAAKEAEDLSNRTMKRMSVIEVNRNTLSTKKLGFTITMVEKSKE
jgi:hypothetical protein